MDDDLKNVSNSKKLNSTNHYQSSIQINKEIPINKMTLATVNTDSSTYTEVNYYYNSNNTSHNTKIIRPISQNSTAVLSIPISNNNNNSLVSGSLSSVRAPSQVSSNNSKRRISRKDSRTSQLNMDDYYEQDNLSPNESSVNLQMSSSPSAKLINVATIKANNENLDEHSSKSNLLNSNNLINTSISSPSLSNLASPNFNNSNKNSKSPSPSASSNINSLQYQQQTKTNLDYFLDYSSNPFTTKFEIIGDANKNNTLRTPQGQKASLHAKKSEPLESNPTETKSDFSLKELANNLNPNFLVTRSHSISNINDKKNPIIIENIVSTVLVKPYTTTSEQHTPQYSGSFKNKHTTINTDNLLPKQASFNLEEPIYDDKMNKSHHNEKQAQKEVPIPTKSSIKQRALQLDESSRTNFMRITEHLYAGNMNSVKNERKMCKLNIEYLIDMTNMRPDDLNRKTLGKFPCQCEKQHSRLYLSIEITDTSFKSLFNAFSEVNKFIQQARKSSQAASNITGIHVDKRVLIFGKESFNQHVLCACAQFLMVEYEMNFSSALNSVLHKNSSIKLNTINECYLNYLKQFESYLKHMSISFYGNFKNRLANSDLYNYEDDEENDDYTEIINPRNQYAPMDEYDDLDNRMRRKNRNLNEKNNEYQNSQDSKSNSKNYQERFTKLSESSSFVNNSRNPSANNYNNINKSSMNPNNNLNKSNSNSNMASNWSFKNAWM